MKKLLPRLALAFLPICIYIAFFITFEPNNYFGIKEEETMFSQIISYTQKKPQSIIIGDSRVANFDMSLVNESAGREFHNLAFGGATLEESLDLLEYAQSENPNLKEVVFGLSFYTVNKSYGTVSRMATIEKQIENPIAYISNFQYNIDALTQFINIIRGVPLGAEHETAEWSKTDYLQNGEQLQYRKDLIAYSAILYTNCAVEGIPKSALPSVAAMRKAMQDNNLRAQTLIDEMLLAKPSNSRFAVNEMQLERLIKAASVCEQKGIKLTVVLPPMHKSVRELVCVPLGIDIEMQRLLTALKAAKVRVLDYEWENSPEYDDFQFFDGFHLDLKYGLPEFTKTLFNEV